MSSHHTSVRAAWLALIFIFLAACGGGSAPDSAAAGRNVEAYLQARVKSNVEQMISLSCADWEAKARIEATSFQSMDAKLDGVTCTAGAADGASSTVTCTGRIVTSYNGESREWRLDERPFSVVLEGGEWRMCGYR
jgi:hypothetical protein